MLITRDFTALSGHRLGGLVQRPWVKQMGLKNSVCRGKEEEKEVAPAASEASKMATGRGQDGPAPVPPGSMEKPWNRALFWGKTPIWNTWFFQSMVGILQYCSCLSQLASLCSMAMGQAEAITLHMELSWNGGTPSHHPFIDGIFHYRPSSYGVPPWLWTPSYESRNGFDMNDWISRPDLWLYLMINTPHLTSMEPRSKLVNLPNVHDFPSNRLV